MFHWNIFLLRVRSEGNCKMLGCLLSLIFPRRFITWRVSNSRSDLHTTWWNCNNSWPAFYSWVSLALSTGWKTKHGLKVENCQNSRMPHASKPPVFCVNVPFDPFAIYLLKWIHVTNVDCNGFSVFLWVNKICPPRCWTFYVHHDLDYSLSSVVFAGGLRWLGIFWYALHFICTGDS